MSSIRLGRTADDLTVELDRHGGFLSEIVSDDPWPVDTLIALHFRVSEYGDPIIWPAVIDDDTATWEVTAEDVAEVLDAHAHLVHLMYSTDTITPIVWARGKVV